MNGALSGDFDVAQLLLSGFVLFFLGLVYHLRREDKREGYPLKDPAGGPDELGFPLPPDPKVFLRPDGTVEVAPRPEPPRPLPARPAKPFPGAPLIPTGDPLRNGVGPASFALRRELPLQHRPNQLQLAPLRLLDDWRVVDGDPDPRGMAVTGSDGRTAGVVRDLWIDRSVKFLRYLEVELAAPAEGIVLLPIHHTSIRRERRQVHVDALPAARFADAPRLAEPDQVTAREEDQVNGFFAGARFFEREGRLGRLWRR